MRQMVDKAFFDSMKVETAHVSRMNDPLHNAVLADDYIDIEILLNALGDSAPASVSKRDSNGRTALHLAVLSSSKESISRLSNCYGNNEFSKLRVELDRLDVDRDNSISKLLIGLQSARSNKDSFDRHKRVIEDWFDNERARKTRQFEFRNEVTAIMNHQGRPHFFYLNDGPPLFVMKNCHSLNDSSFSTALYCFAPRYIRSGGRRCYAQRTWRGAVRFTMRSAVVSKKMPWRPLLQRDEAAFSSATKTVVKIYSLALNNIRLSVQAILLSNHPHNHSLFRRQNLAIRGTRRSQQQQLDMF
jgi:hypothetical protein